MFLQVCVCPQGGGASASVHARIPPTLGADPPNQAPPPGIMPDTPRTRQRPRDQADPPGSRLQNTVYEWPVHILLECILVLLKFEAVACTLILKWLDFQT